MHNLKAPTNSDPASYVDYVDVLNSSPIDELGLWCLQSSWSRAMLWHEEELSMATLGAAPTQPGSPWCLKKEEPVNKDEMEPPTPTTPSTKRSSCIEKQTHLPNESS